MREIRTSGLMSGDGKRGTATAPVLDSTDQRPQASSAGRHHGAAHRCHRASRRYSGPLTAHRGCSPPCAAHSRGCATSSPMPPTPAASSSRCLPSSAPGRSRSSGAPMPPRDSSLCRGDGSSNAPSLGSIAIATSPALSRDELSARPARRPQTLILHRRGYLLLGTNCGSGVSGKPRVQIVPPATVTSNVPSTCCISRRASPTPCRLVSAAAGA